MIQNTLALTPQATLNPKLWEGTDRLKSAVRGTLLRIAEDFYHYVDLEFPVVDIVITGSQVNYNYTALSDLDLHLITDYARIDCDEEADAVFDTKRHLYERERDIKIYGIPVSLYVEDQHSPGVSSGLYSVKTAEWLIRPQKTKIVIDQARINDQYKMWQTILDMVIKTQDLDLIQASLKLISDYRRQGLRQPQGEFHWANLTYKLLRNKGKIAALRDLEQELLSKNLSLG